METLRQQAVRGGAVLAARQALSLVLNLGGTVALTRLLGPTGYGRFAAALGLSAFAFQLGQLGLNAWLVRRPVATPAEEEALWRTARTLLVGAGLLLGAAGLAALPLVGGWLRDPSVPATARWLLLGLPVQLAALVPLAAMERALRYAPVAMADLGGLVLNVGVSVGLAWGGMDAGAMVVGWWVQQAWLLLRLQQLSGIGLGFGFDRPLAREGLRSGLAYAGSLWIWQLRDLVNPLIVARWAGVDGAGIVALAVKLVDAASVVKAAAWRIALPALARVANEPSRLALAVRDGTRLQLAGVAPALLLLVVAVPLLPLVFDERWRALAPVLPFIAAGVAANATFNLQSSALYAVGRAGAVAWHHAAFIALFAGAAALLVPVFGLVGYGLAELAALPAYAVLAVQFRRILGSAAAPPEWGLAFSVVAALAGAAWSPWALVLLLAVPALPSGRRALREMLGALRSGLAARGG